MLKIIDYCLGNDEFTIPGIIREKVEWFGLKIDLYSEMIFIARKNPYPSTKTNKSFLMYGDVPIPETIEYNTTIEDIIHSLTLRIGISKNELVRKPYDRLP